MTDLPELDGYEVLVYDEERNRRLVAAIEIVSPSNKDRPHHRRSFVAKCVGLIEQRVSVVIVDLVTSRNFNLYTDVLELIDRNDPTFEEELRPIYAAAMRWRCQEDDTYLLESWAHPLAIGQPLPTLPLWLADNLSVPLELERTYEETCAALRIK